MIDRERRIRDLAYQIWEEDGRPEGRDARHWNEAERRYAAEEPAASTNDAATAQTAAVEAKRKAPKARAASAAAGTPPKTAGKAVKVDSNRAAEPSAAKPTSSAVAKSGTTRPKKPRA